MRSKLFILILFVLLSCKTENNNTLSKIMIEYQESKKDYTSIATIDFHTSELYFLKLYKNQNHILKTPEEYAESNGSIYKNGQKLDDDLKRIKLKNKEVNNLLDIINSFEEKDFESKKESSTIDGGFVNYHLIYKDTVKNIKRVNNSSEKQVQFNNFIFSLIE